MLGTPVQWAADARDYLKNAMDPVATYALNSAKAQFGGFEIVDQPASTEYDSWWRYLRYTTEDARAVSLDEAKATVTKVKLKPKL